VRTGVFPGCSRASGAKGCVLTRRPIDRRSTCRLLTAADATTLCSTKFDLGAVDVLLWTMSPPCGRVPSTGVIASPLVLADRGYAAVDVSAGVTSLAGSGWPMARLAVMGSSSSAQTRGDLGLRQAGDAIAWAMSSTRRVDTPSTQHWATTAASARSARRCGSRKLGR
jgi:hypothetical protein